MRSKSPATGNICWFSSREELVAGPRLVVLHQLSLWFSCKVVGLRWLSSQAPSTMVGMAVMEVERAPVGPQFPWVDTRLQVYIVSLVLRGTKTLTVGGGG